MKNAHCWTVDHARACSRPLLWCMGIALACVCIGATAQSHLPETVMHDSFDGVTAGPAHDADAARFLSQATFGPTDADIAHLRAVGYVTWLDEQFTAAPTHTLAYMDWVETTLGEQVGQDTRREAWFLGALGGPDPANNTIIHRDQLRQRIAFALSEILVVSEQNAMLAAFPKGLGYYQDLLVDGAFGNYRELLENVTLSPAMGVYLNMLANQRANSAQNIHPDENYAREVNQLFSIGLVMLGPDGMPLLDGSNQPIPTYTQDTISAFAHVFTGWNWFDCGNFTNCGPDYTGSTNFIQPMAAFPAYHDNGTGADDLHNKQLLNYSGAQNGGVLIDGGSPASDLAFALDNIYNHPNVGPFVSRQLIQRLVTSNPSPSYVQRVAAVFDANRASPNQLREVTRAILLDPEARYGQWIAPDTYGKLREPLLALTHFWRAMDARHTCGTDAGGRHFANQPYRYAGYATAWGTQDSQYGSGVGQAPLRAPSVFNFFKPSYLPPGEMTTRNLLGPEFQLQTESVIANTANSTIGRSFAYDTGDPCDPGDDIGEVKVNHSRDLALAGSGSGGAGDPATRLVDAYSTRFMAGQMSPFMRQALLAYLNPIDSSWTDGVSDWRLWRIRTALYLIATSPEYMIQK
jgi:uncharacterized protein (DUF1800 family)